MALFWEDLGASWALLGDCWALLGTLGHLLLAYCASLGRPWAFLGCLPSLFEASWAPLKRFGIDFGMFRGWFGRNLGGSGPQNNCFFKASPPLSLKPPNGLANRTSDFPASGLQSASAGRAKRKQFYLVSPPGAPPIFDFVLCYSLVEVSFCQLLNYT